MSFSSSAISATITGSSTVSLLDLLPDLKRASRDEYAGPCPFWGGKDRFRAWTDTNRYWCRQCEKKGDAIQLLRDRDNLTFADAVQVVTGERPSYPHQRPPRPTADIALARAKKAYAKWVDEKHLELCAQRRGLETELEIAEINCRALTRNPEWFTTEEQSFWEKTLGSLYDKIFALDLPLQILLLPEEQENVANWWLSKEEGDL